MFICLASVWFKVLLKHFELIRCSLLMICECDLENAFESSLCPTLFPPEWIQPTGYMPIVFQTPGIGGIPGGLSLAVSLPGSLR